MNRERSIRPLRTRLAAAPGSYARGIAVMSVGGSGPMEAEPPGNDPRCDPAATVAFDQTRGSAGPGPDDTPRESDFQRDLEAAATAMSEWTAYGLTATDYRVTARAGCVDDDEAEDEAEEDDAPVSLFIDASPLTLGGEDSTTRLTIMCDGRNYGLNIHGPDNKRTRFHAPQCRHIVFEVRGGRKSEALIESLIDLGERLKPLAAARRRVRDG